MKIDLVFGQRHLLGLDHNRLIAQHPIAIYVPVIFMIWCGFPKASRMDGAVYGFVALATVKVSR